jgi:DNA-binding transcriptional MerR regulator
MDYARLQQILTLKLIGLPLEDIKHLLTTDLAEIQDLLGRQKAALQRQVNQLTQIIRTIEKAQDSIRASQTLDWEQFVNIIKAVNMNTQADWLAQFITQEQLDTLADIGKGWTLQEQKRAGEAWKGLFRDVRDHMDKDVHDPAVQQLVDRLDALLAEYTQEDADFAANITRAYAHFSSMPGLEDAPPDIRDWAQQLRDAADFMQRAREARGTA